MAVAALAGDAEAWPLKLEQTQGLRLKRGDVILFERLPHAVVGFDGRDEAYLCWAGGLDGNFDARRTVRVPRQRAHVSLRDTCTRRKLPPLPAIDHMGRPLGEEASPQPRRLGAESLRQRRKGSGCASAEDAFGAAPAPAAQAGGWDVPAWPPRTPTSPEFMQEDTPFLRTVSSATTRTGSPAPSVRQEEQGTAASSTGPAERSARGELPLVVLGPPESDKACTLCTVLRTLTAVASQSVARFGAWLGWAIAQWQQQGSAPSSAGQRPKDEDADSGKSRGGGHGCDTGGRSTPTTGATPRRQESSESGVGKLSARYPFATPSPPRRDTFEDLQITIPIVRPPGWQEVQPLLDGKAVTFDERGLKETMTVKACRWGSFVDRQRLKLEREIRDARGSLRRMDSAGSAGSEASESEDQRTPLWGRKASDSIEDDISELEQLVERMDDWKDLSRYSGKSISMASTRRGNEMKIHVIAFAEREDGAGVDFMRLCYRKSVEVRSHPSQTRAAPPLPVSALGSSLSAFGSSLRSLLPFLPWHTEDQEVSQERWIHLLQRPDVAKFTIAMAFRNALENDGVHFQFCDARLDDPTTI